MGSNCAAGPPIKPAIEADLSSTGVVFPLFEDSSLTFTFGFFNTGVVLLFAFLIIWQSTNLPVFGSSTAKRQIYLRKKELNEELEKLETTLAQAEDDFKETNDSLREELNALDKEYPRGQINLQEGTLTYNPAIKEQLEQQANNLASDNIEVVK